jgi:hypothetical protein
MDIMKTEMVFAKNAITLVTLVKGPIVTTAHHVKIPIIENHWLMEYVSAKRDIMMMEQIKIVKNAIILVPPVKLEMIMVV